MGSSRAIEGEALRSAREADLSRTIETIDAVKSARVHVAAAEPSLFVRDDKPATASVMLTLPNGRSLSDGQVQAIRFIVASSVPGMNAEQVWRSEEHTSELQSLMRHSYAVYCLKRKKRNIGHSE